MLDPRFVSVLSLALAGLCAGCSSDAMAPSAPEVGTQRSDGGSIPRADAAVVSPPPADIGARPGMEGGASPRDDAAAPERVTNTDFDRARVVTVGGQPVLQDVVKAAPESYFAFEGKAGAFYRLSTDVGVYAPDNFLSLYDADRRLIAENDDGPLFPGERADVRLVVRLPADGVYSVKVTAPLLDPSIFESSFPLIYYHLTIDELRPGTEGVSFQGEDVKFVTHAATGYSVTTLLGAFDSRGLDGGDGGGLAGVFRFTGDTAQALIGQVHPSGIHGNGSTALSGLARVQASDGRILAAIDRDRGQSAIHPPVDGEAYTLTLTPMGELGQNAFYAVDLVLIPENTREQSSSTNGALASAEALALEGVTYRQGFILALMEEGDVDYFRFEAAAGDSVSVACEAESAGSGVHRLHAEVRNAQDAVVAAADETLTENLYVEPFAVATAGTHYLRLSADPPTAPQVVPWVRCLVVVGP